MPVRVVGFCADDVGMVEGIGETIASLATRGRLSAASCVTTAPGWTQEGGAVSAATSNLAGFDLGLHFNLTEGAPLSPDLARHWPHFPGLERLIVSAHLGAVPLTALAIELDAQIDAFGRVAGHAPAYIDGHQHVHHLPGVRDVLLRAIARSPGERPAVRNTGHVAGMGFAIKRMLIERTGGRRLEAQLDESGLRHNTVLLGVYDFRASDYRSLVQGWLAAAPAMGGLVFCHPKLGAAHARDAIAAARHREAEYLSSAAFSDDLEAAGVSVGRPWESSSGG